VRERARDDLSIETRRIKGVAFERRPREVRYTCSSSDVQYGGSESRASRASRLERASPSALRAAGAASCVCGQNGHESAQSGAIRAGTQTLIYELSIIPSQRCACNRTAPRTHTHTRTARAHHRAQSSHAYPPTLAPRHAASAPPGRRRHCKTAPPPPTSFSPRQNPSRRSSSSSSCSGHQVGCPPTSHAAAAVMMLSA